MTIAAVTVFEMAIKDIFIDFAKRKHSILGHFTESYFDRINGRIKLQVIQDDYVARFGSRYLNRFKKKIADAEKLHLATHRRGLKSNYANLIVWRNDFAHEGRVPANATYSDAVTAYEDGKLIIRCLAETMVR